MTNAAGSVGLPVTPEFMVGLKVAGFWLHMIFMNLWLTGIPLALFVRRRRPRVTRRIYKVMPFFMAFGINAGLVPLLFLQVLFPEAFHTATILQAWFWFTIIPLLLVAYYAVYLASSGWYRTLSAWVSFLLLTVIGFIFSSSLSLTGRPGTWLEAFDRTTTGGAVTGTYLLITPEVLWRYGVVVGLALVTLAAYLALDAHWIASDRGFRRQVRRLPGALAVLGVGVFLVCGWLYRGYLPPGFTGSLPSIAAGAFPVIALAAGLLYETKPSRTTAASFAGMQLLALLANAVARQIVQIEKLGGWEALRSLPVRGEWGPAVLFLVTLGIGLAVLLWLVRLLRPKTS